MQKQFFSILTAVGLLFGLVLTANLQSSEDDGKLGPIDSITFSGSENDLTISNSGERLSWGDEKTSRAWSIGFMEPDKALEQLMMADHLVEARDELNEELDEQLAAVRATLDAIRDRRQAMDPDDPESPALRQEWDNTNRKFARIQQQVRKIRTTLVADQMQESYSELIEAVNVVSDRMDIDIVIRYIAPDRDFEDVAPETTLLQIRSRTALRIPEGIDITDEVLSELGLEMQ